MNFFESGEANGVQDQTLDVLADDDGAEVFAAATEPDIFEDDLTGVFGEEAPGRKRPDIHTRLSGGYRGQVGGGAAIVFDGDIAEDDPAAGSIRPAFDGGGGAIDAGGGKTGDGDVVGGVTGAFEHDGDGGGDIGHGDIGDQDIFDGAVAGVPAAGLEDDSGQGVGSVGGAVGLKAGAVEETIGDDHVGDRTNDADAVAGAVDDAVVDEQTLDIAAGDGVVAGEEATVGYPDVAAGFVAPSAKVDTVPAAGDRDIVDFDFLAELDHDGVVGRVADGQVANGDIPAVAEKNGMGASHFFFAVGIEYLVSVDEAGARDRNIFYADTEDQGGVPTFGETGFGGIGGGRKGLILFEVRSADEGRTGIEIQGNIVPEMDGAG